MKLHFEPDLDFQLDAIEATCGLFSGQQVDRTEFTVTNQAVGGQGALPEMESELGVGNRLLLLEEDLLENLQQVQGSQGLAIDEGIASRDFTIEMETGTGKTYVYLRSIFELNRLYGFTKFVIVVPSIAIKEGVFKTLQITEEHFRGLYGGVPFSYFTYDSTKLGQVRNFATSTDIQVMVATVGAINKKEVNNLYKESEKTGGERPIDLIKATSPLIIVDEPQSVDGGLSGKGKEALDAMDPLCTLRYSATHVDQHHMVYRLNAVDAYAKRLVKQIEVASAVVEGGHNKAFVKVESIKRKSGEISASLELDVEQASGVKRKKVKVLHGDDLEQITHRDLYADYSVGEISIEPGSEFVELKFPGGQEFLREGAAWGDVDPEAVGRQMIRRTISEHFDKELRLHDAGIKVLSLFFIDAVDHYRVYDDDGEQEQGLYAEMFEEEFVSLANQPKYTELFEGADLTAAARDAHEGYFAIDKKRRWVDTEGEGNKADRENSERAYNLIMRDKEKLLNLETPLRFIFSHSALREGWDNPNVFQICSLRDIRTERERRQTIGRGLRLCVNQEGQRVRGFEVNTLTVMATEAYEEFAAGLQREIEEDTGIRFGVVEKDQFAGVVILDGDGDEVHLGVDGSAAIWEHLGEQGYLSSSGKVQDSLREALRDGALDLPDEHEAARIEITEILKRVAGGLEIKNADERREVRVRRAILDSAEFKDLWDRVKAKTTYRVDFDPAELIARCVEEMSEAPAIKPTRLRWSKGQVAIDESGVTAEEVEVGQTIVVDEGDIQLPDVLTVLEDRTQLKRRTILDILLASERLDDFKRNPQQFIEMATEIINRRKRLMLVDGIKYQKIGDGEFFAQELFDAEELTAYVKDSAMGTKKSVYEPVTCDSNVEKNFVTDLEHNEVVKVYAKLPYWFTVPTPLGSYNPDWALVVEVGEGERLYFVVETKGTLSLSELRDSEAAKIKCGKAHFEAIAEDADPARYQQAVKLDDVLAVTEQG